MISIGFERNRTTSLARCSLALAVASTPLSALGAGDPSLVAHYALDGDALDSSGNGHHGTIFEAQPATDRFGVANGAMEFDGVDDHIYADASAFPSGERTVSLWFFADTLVNKPAVLGYGGGACGTTWFQGLNNTVPAFNSSYYVTAHCQAKNLIVPYASEPIGIWVHWAITTAPDGTRLYIDGLKKSHSPVHFDDTYVLGKQLALGVTVGPNGLAPYEDGNSHFLDGRLDDVRIYDRALDETEIFDLFLETPCAKNDAATQIVRPGDPPNPSTLVPGQAPTIGAVWNPSIDHSSFETSALLDVLILGIEKTEIHLPPYGTLLCDLDKPHLLLPSDPGQAFEIPIPFECELIGLSLRGQGLSMSLAKSRLTNAIDIVIGAP